ncbi:MAG: hypothetical protein LQ337_003369 [Flavoplaca oasis]|nr:MAG: hypothetical protein LQ337_003369 [Flavoplaca oasis]
MHLSCRSGYLSILETSWKPFPGAIDVGGCDQDIQNLRDSYSQAIELCQAAIAALGNIEEPKPEDPAEGQEWDRQARLAKAIFNIDANPAAPITDRAMRSRLGTILSEYTGEARREEDAEKMIGHYKRIIRQASTPSATKRIYCTPRFMSEASFANGAFVWKKFDRWETGELAIPEPVEDPDPEEYLCIPDGQAVSAFVHRFAEMVVWCETGLRRTPLLGNNVQDANTRVKAGDSLPYAMSTTWMHEVMHVWPENPYGESWENNHTCRS